MQQLDRVGDARAFPGELVSTEAELAAREGREYEPASVLLERIRAERDEQEAARPVWQGRKTAVRSRRPRVANSRHAR